MFHILLHGFVARVGNPFGYQEPLDLAFSLPCQNKTPLTFSRYMFVCTIRMRPVTTGTDIQIPRFPVWTVLARPTFCTVIRRAEQHNRVIGPFFGITSDTEGNTMIHLKYRRFKLTPTRSTTRSVIFDQLILN